MSDLRTRLVHPWGMPLRVAISENQWQWFTLSGRGQGRDPQRAWGDMLSSLHPKWRLPWGDSFKVRSTEPMVLFPTPKSDVHLPDVYAFARADFENQEEGGPASAIPITEEASTVKQESAPLRYSRPLGYGRPRDWADPVISKEALALARRDLRIPQDAVILEHGWTGVSVETKGDGAAVYSGTYRVRWAANSDRKITSWFFYRRVEDQRVTRRRQEEQMKQGTLRSKLIHLAHSNPEMRGHILPLVTAAGPWRPEPLSDKERALQDSFRGPSSTRSAGYFGEALKAYVTALSDGNIRDVRQKGQELTKDLAWLVQEAQEATETSGGDSNYGFALEKVLKHLF